MPVVHGSHARPADLEHEFRELWRMLDAERAIVEAQAKRIEALEAELALRATELGS